MAHQTPRHRLQRPSYGNIGGSAEKNSYLSASTNVNRKASLQALTGDPRTPAPGGDDSLEVGDVVNVPGEMFGTVKFVGSVRGKAGKFVGVELDAEFAARGKNNGDVDGISYFQTNIPGSGIFLPTHRAEKRMSPTFSNDNYSPTPATPSHSTLNGQRTKQTPTTPGANTRFAQSVGPGAARPSSPQFKPKRPSLPRPESPLRKPPPNLQPTPARPGFSQSVRGARPPVTQTPSRNNLRASTNTRGAGATPARPSSRTASRQAGRQDTGDDGRPRTAGRRPSNGIVPSYGQTTRSPSRLGSAGSQDSAEVQRLKNELADRDKRLDEQAASLAEMEASVKELSAIMPIDGPPPQSTPSHGSPGDDTTVAQLRQMIREKNDKIGSLTAEFDAHRADFRSTLDSLEMASAETERVYEEQKTDLLQQISELQELNQQSQDFEAVAAQLRQLEDLVAELEEGLEESRRGEAEARGEVEFLRGEVERGRSELRREREKAAAVLKYTESGRNSINPKELEERDDEIRGLKAVINRMSADTSASGTNGVNHLADPEEIKKLQAIVEENRVEKEELEREIEQLRREAAAPTTNGNGFTHSRQESEMTTLGAGLNPLRPRGDTMKATFAEHAQRNGLDEDINGATGNDSGDISGLYCEMCGSDNHDTLDCTDLLHPQALSTSRKPSATTPADTARDHSPGKENAHVPNGTAEKPTQITGNGDAEKWCALCEKDGHLAYDCPDEQF